jgi:hypothetical protein
MRCIGLSLDGKGVKIAVLSKVKNHLTIERLEAFAEVPPALFQEKNIFIVSGLPTEDIVRREVALKLTRRAAVLKALPFQLEALLPFALDEAIAHPFFTSKDGETEAVVLATTRLALKRHIELLKEKGIDPDQISCVPAALSHWVKLIFPEQKFVTFIHESSGLALEGEKIVFSQAFEDKERLTAFLKNKFGHHWMVPDEGPSLQDYPYENLKEFAVPIGLALQRLEKNSCQFRQGEFRSPKEIQNNRFFLKASLIASLSLAVIAGGLGGWILHGREQALHKKIEPYFSAPSLSLGEKIAEWQKKITQDSKGFPLLPDVPSVRDALAWLGEFQEPIEIVQFHYSLVQYPKAGEKEEPYSVKIDLEFKAASPAAAQRFQETVEKVPTLVDKKQKIAWTAHADFYKISFYLRRT